jgi:hypothetical protein
MNFTTFAVVLTVCWVMLNVMYHQDGFMGHFVLFSKTTLKIFMSFLLVFVFAFFADRFKRTGYFLFVTQLLAVSLVYIATQRILFMLLK